MSVTQHIGFGRFHLENFRPGELLARFDGALAMVCDPQPAIADHVQVWIEYGTANARKELLHKTALAHAISSEQAAMLERRIKRAKGGPA